MPRRVVLACALLAGAAALSFAAPEDDFISAIPAASAPEPVAAALAGIRAEALAAHVAFLASPALEGRGLGSRGLDAAAEYVASFLALHGIPPLADEGRARYFQPVPLRELSGYTGELTIEARRGGKLRRRAIAPGKDCVFAASAPRGAGGPIVFAGHGVREESLHHDDYADLDVRGKVVLVLAGVPAGEAWQTPALTARYAAEDVDDRWEAKLDSAAALGAAAVLALDPQDAGRQETRFFLGAEAPEPGPVLVRLSGAAARSVLAATGLDKGDVRPRALESARAQVRTRARERKVESRNVLGVITGSDPALRDEAIVIGAHLDHLGRRGDAIYPGADDNSSGVAALLEIARVFAALPARPARSIVVAFWTGEEEGKFGSGHYVRHPAWPLARTRAYVNLDMIGHPWLPKELEKLVADTGLAQGPAFLARTSIADFAEPGIPVDAPALAEALTWAGPVSGMALHLDRCDGTRGGSDYRDFARANVPWIRFFGNFFPAYHEPGDTPDALDAAQVRRMARLAFATAWRLAAPDGREAR
ncbi:MAG: M20/M25/M40 family metallo-hydrolase [Acidobacteria bacterium]|nr:M20/M25/M40 family metallo-hydrolase [Acidobacteriota bacterium]